MDLRNTPMQEQFKMLTYLNTQLNNSSSYIYQYLKTKNKYQISFVKYSSYKFQSDCPLGCLKDAIICLAEEFKKKKTLILWTLILLKKIMNFLKIKVAQLEKEIEDLKKQQDGSFSVLGNLIIYLSHLLEMILAKRKRKGETKTKKS